MNNNGENLNKIVTKEEISKSLIDIESELRELKHEKDKTYTLVVGPLILMMIILYAVFFQFFITLPTAIIIGSLTAISAAVIDKIETKLAIKKCQKKIELQRNILNSYEFNDDVIISKTMFQNNIKKINKNQWCDEEYINNQLLLLEAKLNEIIEEPQKNRIKIKTKQRH